MKKYKVKGFIEQNHFRQPSNSKMTRLTFCNLHYIIIILIRKRFEVFERVRFSSTLSALTRTNMVIDIIYIHIYIYTILHQ
jgi:hypothetical protein